MAADAHAGAYAMRQSAFALIVYCQCEIAKSDTATNLGNSGGIDGDAVERAEVDDYAAILTTEAEGGAGKGSVSAKLEVPELKDKDQACSGCPQSQRARKPKERVEDSLL